MPLATTGASGSRIKFVERSFGGIEAVVAVWDSGLALLVVVGSGGVGMLTKVDAVLPEWVMEGAWVDSAG